MNPEEKTEQNLPNPAAEVQSKESELDSGLTGIFEAREDAGKAITPSWSPQTVLLS